MLNLLAKFHATTAHWLIQVNLNEINEEDDNDDYAPKQHRPLTFPLSEIVPITLRYNAYIYILYNYYTLPDII